MATPAHDVDIAHTALLARLELTDAEKSAMQHEIEDIVGYVRLLQEVDVDGVEPTAHAAPVHNVFRKDASAPSMAHERMMDNAPDTIDDELIKVPVVLGGDEPGSA